MDTSVKIDDETRDTFKELAEGAGMSMKDYLAQVAAEKKNEQLLDTATAVFRRVISEPGVIEAFDTAFGGLPPVAPDSSRAA